MLEAKRISSAHCYRLLIGLISKQCQNIPPPLLCSGRDEKKPAQRFSPRGKIPSQGINVAKETSSSRWNGCGERTEKREEEKIDKKSSPSCRWEKKKLRFGWKGEGNFGPSELNILKWSEKWFNWESSCLSTHDAREKAWNLEELWLPRSINHRQSHRIFSEHKSRSKCHKNWPKKANKADSSLGWRKSWGSGEKAHS